mgnify:CR=1 FL=1
MKKSLYTKFVVIVSLLTVFPFITFAQTPIGSNVNVNPVVQQTRNLKGLVALFTEYLNIAIGLIIALSVVTFIWHVYLYFFTEKEKTEAGKYVMYSVIGFFVMLSFWGLVAILSNTFNLPTQRPNFPFGGGSTDTKTTFPGM